MKRSGVVQLYVRVQAEPDAAEVEGFFAGGPEPRSFSRPPDLAAILAAAKQADPRLESLSLKADFDVEGHCFLGTLLTGRANPTFLVEDLYRLADAIRGVNPRSGVDIWLKDDQDTTIGLEIVGTTVTLDFDRRGY